MKNLLYISFIILINFFDTTKAINLSFEKQFPIKENEKYTIIFHKETENLPLYTLILFKISKGDNILEKAVLNPGFLKGLPKPIFGDYFTVLKYNITKTSTIVVLTFNRLSNGEDLTVLYFETKSSNIRNKILNNHKEERKYLMIIRISLKLSWTLKLTLKTIDHREGGLLIGSLGSIICHAAGGSPFSQASISVAGSLDEVMTDVGLIDPNQNEVVLTFMPSIKDHGKKIVCNAGEQSITSVITIFHHPTTINIVPDITSYVKNDSSFLCKASDGYPTPKSQWTLHKGPPYAERFYSIKSSNDVLHMKKNAPLGSKWVFKCRATNTIPNSLDNGITKTVAFIIGVKPFSRILLVVLITAFLLLLCIICLCILLFRRRKGSKYKNSKLINTITKNHGILRFHGDMTSKNPLVDESKHDSCAKNSLKGSGSSLSKELKEKNPVDLV